MMDSISPGKFVLRNSGDVGCPIILVPNLVTTAKRSVPSTECSSRAGLNSLHELLDSKRTSCLFNSVENRGKNYHYF